MNRENTLCIFCGVSLRQATRKVDKTPHISVLPTNLILDIQALVSIEALSLLWDKLQIYPIDSRVVGQIPIIALYEYDPNDVDS